MGNVFKSGLPMQDAEFISLSTSCKTEVVQKFSLLVYMYLAIR